MLKKIKQKSKIIFFFFFIGGNIIFSNTLWYNEEILNQRLGVVNNIKNIYSKKNLNNIILADVISADEFLKQISLYKTSEKLPYLELYFPDVSYIDEYIENVSNKVKKINIFLLKSKTNDKYMKNRDYISYQEREIDKKIKKLNNITIFVVDISENDIFEIFLESLEKKVNETKYYKFIQEGERKNEKYKNT